MRPKVLLLTLVAAFAVLGIVAVLKGVMGGHSGNAGGTTSGTDATANSQAASTNDQSAPVSLNSSNAAANSEQWRAAMIQKELDEIQGLLGAVGSTNSPMITAALVGKVENPEAEVRKAALTALMQLNDTNAVSGLQKVADNLKDPRAKVEVMDVIDYLNLPDTFPAVQPPETMTTNDPNRNPSRDIKMNPKFLHTNSAPSRIRRPAPDAPAAQPQ